jgi:hypothetical protein
MRTASLRLHPDGLVVINKGHVHIPLPDVLVPQPLHLFCVRLADFFEISGLAHRRVFLFLHPSFL